MIINKQRKVEIKKIKPQKVIDTKVISVSFNPTELHVLKKIASFILSYRKPLTHITIELKEGLSDYMDIMSPEEEEKSRKLARRIYDA